MNTKQDGDLSQLSDLSVDTILKILKTRFEQNSIYSRCGDILIAVNPYQTLGIYNKKHNDLYSKRISHLQNEPHIFGTTSLAYQRLQETKTNQVILVSGESGAGKTETTKYVIQHILHICNTNVNYLQNRIYQINPLLEAFGNARTNLNENSSRFAKFIQLNFSSDWKVQGAIVSDYLLEKSRVVHQPDGEGNFHIFYAFYYGLDQNMKRNLNLDDREYRIISSCHRSKDEYRRRYNEYMEMMKTINMTPEDIDIVHIIMATIMHITEIEFGEDDEDSIGVIVLNEDDMFKASALLNIDANEFAEALVSEVITFGGEVIRTLKTIEQAQEGRDALAKSLYERLFGWMIRKMNISLNIAQTSGKIGEESPGSLGILDICGFEIMRNNSLEQMCINLVNEHLQGFMNQQVFKREQELYSYEGLTLEDINYPNNESILKLFEERRIGIIHLIDEDTKLAQATTMSMAQKIQDTWRDHSHFICPHYETPIFGIRHFAGEVTYDASSFLKKNGDNLNADLTKCMVSSENDFISDLFQVQKSDTGSISSKPYEYRQSRGGRVPVLPGSRSQLTKSKVFNLRQSMKSRGLRNGSTKSDSVKDSKTQLSYFTASIKDLLNKMRSAEPLFVRCIKPNEEQRPYVFDDNKVQEQLNYLGIKEIAKIRQLCFPVRRTYEDFRERYGQLAQIRQTEEDKVICKEVLRHFIKEKKLYCLGKTQIFMLEEVKITLETVLMIQAIHKTHIIKRCLKQWKRFVTNKRLKRRKDSEKLKLELEETKAQEIRSQDPLRKSGRISFSALEDIEEASGSGVFKSLDSSNNQGSAVESYGSSEENSSGSHVTIRDVLHGDDNKEEEAFGDPIWDSFEILEREAQSSDSTETRFLKTVKVCLYLLLFIVLLGSCVVQKISLLLTVNNIRVTGYAQGPKHSVFILNCALVICIPYGLAAILAMMKMLFGKFRRPSKTVFIVVFITEILHTAGLCVLVYGILPYCNMLFGALLLSAVAVIPSIFHLVTATHRASTNSSVSGCAVSPSARAVSYFVDGICIMAQVSVIASLILLFLGTDILAFERFDRFKDINYMKYIEICCGFVLVSIKCWENFLDNRFLCKLKHTNKVRTLFLSIRYELQEGRHSPFIIANIGKIGTTILMVFVYYPHIFDQMVIKQMLDQSSKLDYASLVPIISLHLSPLIAFYVSNLACKLNMQIFSFSLPLLLCSPVVVAILLGDCHNNFLVDLTKDFHNNFCIRGNLKEEYLMFIGVAWYLSLFWITRHIWYPRQERLAKRERIFVQPLYCPILTTEGFVLNRRRHMRKVQKQSHKKGKSSIITYRLAKTEDKGENEDNITDQGSEYNTLKPKDVEVPAIYACATMWHETRTEMVQLLKSIHRIDADQWLRTEAQKSSDEPDPDYYNFEAHIFFDDIMEETNDNKWQVNDFVVTLVECMDEAISSVHNTATKAHSPIKVATPYGGQLIYKMPGGNFLYVHLKDKNKIRHRKRWSQVMYMYYLLGYKLLKDCEIMTLDNLNGAQGLKVNRRDLEELMSEKTKTEAQNTFILALDGDTDFTPVAVRLLLDRMKKNDKAGAACGRIHPIGSGPLVWFQKFEYAVGHWLQKATEHVLGCVLCSPGCFSLFRGSALMDQNVMRKYAILPNSPGHYLQYDQGEDRWLCTLLLQQGYRIDYAAAADAVTYSPEGFNEFFNQRRRWMPSTMANIMDLLGNYKSTVDINNNISIWYIIYQFAIMVSTILGPATVIMMIASAFKEVLTLNIWLSYALALLPAAAYVLICMKCNSDIQLKIAGLLSVFYVFIMMIVLSSVIILVATKPIYHPGVIFVIILASIFILSGLMHPYELNCLPLGVLYFVCIPAGYLLLVIFSMCNLDNISWGTREVKSKADMAAEKKAAEEKKKKEGFLSKIFGNAAFLQDIKEILSFGKKSKEADPVLEEIKIMNENLKVLLGNAKFEKTQEKHKPDPARRLSTKVKDSSKKPKQITKPEMKSERNVLEKEEDPSSPFWIRDTRLGSGSIRKLNEEENLFWKQFIRKYLYPLEKDEDKEKQVKASLVELKSNVVFGMSLINLLWIGINFIFQNEPIGATSLTITYVVNDTVEVIKTETLGFLFILFFGVVLIVQFLGMLSHRWGTFLHLMSITDLSALGKKRSKFDEMLIRYKEWHDSPFELIDPEITTPPDVNNDGVVIGKTIRASMNPAFRKSARPLPALPPKEESFKRQRSWGFNLRQTRNNLIRRAENAGFTVEDPMPDYDDDNDDVGLDDPMYNTVRDKNTMNRMMARRYLASSRRLNGYAAGMGRFSNHHNIIETTQF